MQINDLTKITDIADEDQIPIWDASNIDTRRVGFGDLANKIIASVPVSELAQAWAESPTAPDPMDPTSKSSKTWAGISEDWANIAEAAALSYQQLPDPCYLAWGGQSNALGSDGGSGTNWITEAGRVFVWVPSSGLWVDAVGMQGIDPFNTDGSNCPGVHVAMEIAIRHGIVVRMIMGVEGSTEICKWTGGGYENGVPIPTDRTVSDTNRVEFKKWTDAITAAGIAQFDLFGWCQGEADLDTPEAIYLEEIAYLVSDLKTRGTAPDATRRFPTVVFGLYTGVKSGQQARRTRTLERFARDNPGYVTYSPGDDLEGRDDTPGDPNSIINHFSSAAYSIMGYRGAVAILGLWFGQSYLSDQRINDITIPPSGLDGQKIGHRTYEMTAISSGTLALTVDAGQMRGETYPLSGTVTVNMDPTANAALGEGGLGFEFYTLSNSDSITFKSDDGAGGTRQIQQMGEAAAAAGDVGIVITGAAGRGRIVFEGSRYVIEFWARTSHSQAVIEGGTNTSRRRYNPLELRQAANAAITARAGYQTLATDANASPSLSNGSWLLHTGTLTGNRILSLTQTNVYAGARFRVTRTGAGAFTLTVRDNVATGNAKALSTGQWVDFTHDGTAWVQSAFGSL